MSAQIRPRRAQPDAQPADAESIEGFHGYNLKRAYMVFRDDFRRVVGEAGLSPRVFSALSLIVETPDMTQSELARRLGIERSGLVAIVDELETRGLARRCPVPGDRRAQALSPTAQGIHDFEQTVALVRRHEDALLSVLTSEEQALLLGLLRKFRFANEGGN